MYKIYKISNDKGDVYYGSTKQTLQQRLYNHTTKGENSKSYLVLHSNYKISLMEGNIPSRHIALIREGYYIANFNCVNRHNPDPWIYKNITERRLKKEYADSDRGKEVQHNWYEKNKEKCKAKSKRQRETNREELKEWKKKHYKYQSSWGGNKYTHNNLLIISIDIFI